MPRRRNIDHSLKERRERKYRLRSRTHRFIPPKDSDFAHMGRTFANHIAAHAKRLGVPAGKVEELLRAVAAFRDALCRAMQRSTAGPKATSLKNDARKRAEKALRAMARLLRGTAEEALDGFDRMQLNMPERPKRSKPVECPLVAPVLRFVGSIGHYGIIHNQAGGLRHVLEYSNDFDYKSSARPHGAARLELFVELVPIGQPIPAHPGERSGGRHWYLRSYTTSRFEVDYPVMDDGTPVRVVYWGRWADAKGGFGPFSETCVACVEGAPGLLGIREAPLLGAKREQIRVTQVRDQIEAKIFMNAPWQQHALPAAQHSFEPRERAAEARLLPGGPAAE